MIVHNKTGGRTIELFIPFDHGGKKIESITFAPFRLGHAMRWSAGDWKTSIELMVELAGVDEWLKRQRTVELDGRTFFVLGDRFASKAEAMLTFAAEHGLVADDDLRKAAAAQPLPSDVEGVAIEPRKGDK